MGNSFHITLWVEKHTYFFGVYRDGWKDQPACCTFSNGRRTMEIPANKGGNRVHVYEEVPTDLAWRKPDLVGVMTLRVK